MRQIYHDNLSEEKIEVFLKTRNHYGHSFLCKELFDLSKQLKQKKFYGILCESSHADINGLLLDYPAYNEKQIEDNLKITLMLSYGNIQMVSEMFLAHFNDILKYVVTNILKEVTASVGNQIPLFEPNKDNYGSKLQLKNGNFIEVLGSN